MKTMVSVCVCVVVALLLPSDGFGASKRGGSGGRGGRGAGGAARMGGSGGGGARHGGMRMGGGGQRNMGRAHANHGLNRGRNQAMGGRGRANVRGARTGRAAALHSGHRLAVHNRVGHWRTGMHWRNSHLLFANYHAVWHNRWWWNWHYNRVVLIGGGWWYWDGGYWFPAWGYDPLFTAYVYDGPIYSYANLPPDQVIVSVQEILQDQGYYSGPVDGQLGKETRDAIEAYQRDHALELTAAIDEPTVQSLGLA